MNRLKDASYDDQHESFTYDKVGNRLTKTTNDITNGITEDVIEKYTYNAKNQLKEFHNKNGINYFTYDKQGNTIKEETATGNNIFEYNTLNQQVKAITKEGNTLVSRYDAEGLRAEIEENEKLTKFIFHKDNVLVEADKDYNVISRFTRGYEVVAADIEEPNSLGSNSNLEFSSNINRYYYTVDEQGSTVFISDRNQQIKNEYRYDAFGCILDSKEQVHNRITYAGQQFDGITGQYYLRARFYNPIIGRFTQEDIYKGDGLNLYAYCGNNPVAYYDPSGYTACSTKYSSYKKFRDQGLSPQEALDKVNSDWVYSKGYKPKPGERTFDGYMKNNVSVDKEVTLHTKSSGFNTNPKNSDGQFKRFGTKPDQHGIKGPHVHQPTRNVNPKTGMINGGQGRQTKNNGVTEPGRKDIKQLYEYLENGKYHK